MFKKLRNDFIRLNVIIISLVMLFAFTAVYLTVSYTVQKDNQAKLNLAVSSGQLGQGSVAAQGGEFYGNNEQITSLSFSVLVDSHSTLQNQGNIIFFIFPFSRELTTAQLMSLATAGASESTLHTHLYCLCNMKEERKNRNNCKDNMRRSYCFFL